MKLDHSLSGKDVSHQGLVYTDLVVLYEFRFVSVWFWHRGRQWLWSSPKILRLEIRDGVTRFI